MHYTLDTLRKYLDRDYRTACECLHQEKELREQLTEREIDHMIEDSFPASDPPSTY